MGRVIMDRASNHYLMDPTPSIILKIPFPLFSPDFLLEKGQEIYWE